MLTWHPAKSMSRACVGGHCASQRDGMVRSLLAAGTVFESTGGMFGKCSSSLKLVILFVVIAAAVIVLWLAGIVSVVCSIVLSKGCRSFM